MSKRVRAGTAAVAYPSPMDSKRRPATYEDLLALPEDVRAEIVHGELVKLPAPLPEHSRLQRTLSSHIGRPFDDDDGRGGPGGWWILVEVDVRLDVHEIVRPDVAGWRRERLPSPWGKRPIDVVPDWICEVLSPSNEAHDRVKKRRLYAASGVSFYWMVDPAERTLEALRLVDGRWVDAGSFDDAAVAAIPPFDAIEIEVARLFPPLQSIAP
jgi:Uma2 family endonuclease